MISKRIKSKPDQVFIFVYKCERKRFRKEYKDVTVKYIDSEVCIEHKDFKTINEAEKQLKLMVAEFALVFVPGQQTGKPRPQLQQLLIQYELEILQRAELDEVLKLFDQTNLEKMITYMRDKMRKGKCSALLIIDSADKQQIQQIVDDAFGVLRHRSYRLVESEVAPMKEEVKEVEAQPPAKRKYKPKEQQTETLKQQMPEQVVSSSNPTYANDSASNVKDTPPTQKILARETVSASVFDRDDFELYINQTLLSSANIEIRLAGQIVSFELFGQDQNTNRVRDFQRYFHYRSYCFFERESLSAVVDILQRFKLKYPLLKIGYVDGYSPYTNSELQSQLHWNSLIGMIESNQTMQSKHNCYEFSGACFEGIKNISKLVCEQFRMQLKLIPDTQKPEQQSWTISLPAFLLKNRKNDRLEELVLKQFAQCFNAYAEGQGQLIDSELTSQGIRCTINVPEPKSKEKTLEQIKRLLTDIIASKLLKFDCPPGLTAQELEQVAVSVREDVVFVQNEAVAVAVCTDPSLFTKLLSQLETLKVVEKIRVSSHLSEVLNDCVKTYAIIGTNINTQVISQQYVIDVSGYKFKVERVMANLDRLIKTVSRKKHENFVMVISQDQHALLTLNRTFEKAQSDFIVKVASSDQQIEEVSLVLPNQQCLTLSNLEQSNEDVRDYVNIFASPNDWADAFPDQALDAVYNPKLMPSKKALYMPNIGEISDAVLADYNSQLNGRKVGRICLLMPEGDPSKGFDQLLKLLRRCSTVSSVVIHPRKPVTFAELKSLFEKFKTSKQVVRIFNPQSKQTNPRKRKWSCIIDNNARSPYSEAVNTKLNQALARSQVVVELDETDVPPVEDTHEYLRAQHQIRHLKSGTVIPLKRNPIPAPNLGFFDKMFRGDQQKGPTFEPLYDYDLGGPRKLPKSEVDKIKLSPQLSTVPLRLGLYTVDTIKLIQTNLYSGFRRKVEFQDELQQDDNALDVSKVVSQNQQSRRVRVELEATARHTLTNAKQFIQRALDQARGVEMALEFDVGLMPETEILNYCFEKSILVVSSQLSNSTLKVKLMCGKKSDLEPLDINYKSRKMAAGSQPVAAPDYWNAHQGEYSIHDVDSNTPEFARVSQEFKIAPITSLKRVQNRFIWKMYTQEKRHLQEISKCPNLHEMMLFHGTRTNPPEKVYEDKEEAFNINYSSDSNMFGRGIYFAKEAMYSHSYAFVKPTGGRRMMLYCRVLVGSSEERQHNEACRMIKDTSIRDVQNGIKYESIKSNYGGSDIYIIYKSRRAYPEYVIEY